MDEIERYRRNIGQFYCSLKTHGGPFPQSYGRVTKALGKNLGGWLISEMKAAGRLLMKIFFLVYNDTYTQSQEEKKMTIKRKDWKRMRNRGKYVRSQNRKCRRERKRLQSLKTHNHPIQEVDNLPKKKKEKELSVSQSNGKPDSQSKDSSQPFLQNTSVNAIKKSNIAKETDCRSTASHNNCCIPNPNLGIRSAQIPMELSTMNNTYCEDFLTHKNSKSTLALSEGVALWHADRVGGNDDAHDSVGDPNENEESRAETNTKNQPRLLQNTHPGSNMDTQICPVTPSNRAISPTLSLAAIKEQSQIQNEDMKTNNNQMREQMMCKICKIREITTANQPCGHLVCCRQCASASNASNACPVCRVNILETLEVKDDI